MAELLPSFDEFWAVVVNDTYGAGRRLLWSPHRQGWLPSRAYGHGFQTTPANGSDSRPYDDELQAVPTIARRLLDARGCYRCGLSELSEHFIAPDVFGRASLHCVQLPNPRIVTSFGGSGRKKHWASFEGCNSVVPEFLTDSHGDHRVTWGEGLVATYVRDLDWCARCTQSAGNIARAADSSQVSPDDYVEHRERERLVRRSENVRRSH